MAQLNGTAKAALRAAGVSQAAWARAYFADGRWHGDACGCSDDRCIGYHHAGPDDCRCLPALLADPPSGISLGSQPGHAEAERQAGQ